MYDTDQQCTGVCLGQHPVTNVLVLHIVTSLYVHRVCVRIRISDAQVYILYSEKVLKGEKVFDFAICEICGQETNNLLTAFPSTSLNCSTSAIYYAYVIYTLNWVSYYIYQYIPYYYAWSWLARGRM